MSLGIALNSAISGLRLNQQAMSVLSNNLANANTEGYSRKTLEQSAVYVEGVGSGVRLDDVVRKVDSYLLRSVQTQASVTQKASTVSNYYDRVQVLLGSPGAENSIDEYMTTFFTTMQQMADQPDRTSYRSNMVNAANLLAEQVSSLAREVEGLRFQADGDIKAALTDTNAAMKKLFELNVAIARASAVGQSTAGLLDERDKAIGVLAANMDITTFYKLDGTVTVSTGNGAALVDGILHQITYSQAGSIDTLIGNERLNPMEVINITTDGSQSGPATELVSGGKLGEVTSTLNGGTIQGLLELRDNLLPAILDQLDMLASRLRDTVNKLHNNGSGYPPAQALTATHSINATLSQAWSGSLRIAVLTAGGTPVTAPYLDESYTGIRPLTLNLSTLSTNGTPGVVSTQTIIDEINNHFGAPVRKVQLGNINNIQLASGTSVLPNGATSQFNFDLDLDNISGGDARVFVTDITVRNDATTDITNVTQPAPGIALQTTNTYTTFDGESYVDVALDDATGLAAGDTIYLGAPGVVTANGITAAQLTGYFTVTQVSGNSVRIVTTGTAGAGAPVADASGVVAQAPYATIAGGEKRRTTGEGQLQVDFGNVPSAYYDISMNVGVLNPNGSISISQITYRVNNNETDLYNRRYQASSFSGSAEFEQSLTTQASLRAIMVDADGIELAKQNGKYLESNGFLKIVGVGDYTVAIDELDSQQLGDASGFPSPIPGTYRGFSHYFGMNDFFVTDGPATVTSSVRNSAVNLAVQQRLIDNPNLVSSGQLSLQIQSVNASDKPQYTYLRYAGDNRAAQAIADLSGQSVIFDAAGGLPYTSLSLQAYTSELLGYVAALSNGASDLAQNAQLLYDGFNNQLKSQSGVNLDEELANTVIFQNSYSATARIISVVDEMFKTLIDSV